MKTDLEHEIRDALHARARLVTVDTVRYATEPRGPRAPNRAAWLMLAAAAVVAALAVMVAIAPWRTDHGNPAAAGGTTVPVAKSSWQLVRAYAPDGTVVSGTAVDPPVGLNFKPGHNLLGTDGVSTIDATYIPTSDGFRVTAIAGSANGYAGNDRRVLAVKSAMDAIFFDADGGPVDVVSRVHGDLLTLEVSGYTLQLRRL